MDHNHPEVTSALLGEPCSSDDEEESYRGDSERPRPPRTSGVSFTPLLYGFLSVAAVTLGLLEIGTYSDGINISAELMDGSASLRFTAEKFVFVFVSSYSFRLYPSPVSCALEPQNPHLTHVNSEYTRVHGAPGKAYPWVSDAAPIVEPHRITTFVASGMKHTDSSLVWQVNGRRVDSSSSASARHKELEHQFTDVGTYEVEVQEWRPNAESGVQSASALVHCRYVRREMRSLTQKDRTALLSAMVILWDEKTVITKNIYGFAEQHALLAGDEQCDHMHDGMGFFTQRKSHEQLLALLPELGSRMPVSASCTVAWRCTQQHMVDSY